MSHFWLDNRAGEEKRESGIEREKASSCRQIGRSNGWQHVPGIVHVWCTREQPGRCWVSFRPFSFSPTLLFALFPFWARLPLTSKRKVSAKGELNARRPLKMQTKETCPRCVRDCRGIGDGGRCCEQRKQATNVLVVVLPRVLFLKFPQKSRNNSKISSSFRIWGDFSIPLWGMDGREGKKQAVPRSAESVIMSQDRRVNDCQLMA